MTELSNYVEELGFLENEVNTQLIRHETIIS
jgi:hypothetical protein